MKGETQGVGRTEEVVDRASAALASAMLATLDRDPSVLADGDPLPPLFHWMYCRELAPGSQLDVDGHQKRGDFLPALPFSRRMWAGGRLKFDGTVRVGDGLRRRSTVVSVTPKTGRSGPLVLVTVEHRISGQRRGDRRGTGSGLPRAAHRTAGAAGRFGPEGGDGVVGVRHAERRHAVPVFGAHLQRAPHPLRPGLRARHRDVPGSRRARPAHGAAPRGSRGPALRAPAANAHVPGPPADVRRPDDRPRGKTGRRTARISERSTKRAPSRCPPAPPWPDVRQLPRQGVSYPCRAFSYPCRAFSYPCRAYSYPCRAY